MPTLTINLTLLEAGSVVGVFCGAFTGREFEENQRNIKDINAMIEANQIRAQISKEVPMEQATEAGRMNANRGVIGNIVLVNKDEALQNQGFWIRSFTTL